MAKKKVKKEKVCKPIVVKTQATGDPVSPPTGPKP